MTTPSGPTDPYQGSQPQQPGGYPPPAGYPQQPGGFPPPAPEQAGGFPPAAPQPGQGAYYPPQPGAYDFGADAPSGAPAGAPGFQSPMPPPAPVPRRGFNWKRLIIPAVVLLAAGGYFIYQQNTGTENAKVGDCIEIKSVSPIKADTAQIDCGDTKAVYKVVETGGASLTCDLGETSFTQGSEDGDVDTKLCLQENVAVGDCWVEGSTTTAPVKMACTAVTDKAKTLKVLTVDRTTADFAKCPTGTVDAYGYEKRKVLICFGEVT